jgi:nucleoside phosphorylase
MTEYLHVEGVANLDGTTSITGSAIGPGATTINTPSPTPIPSATSHDGAGPRDIGIITILPEETHAVIHALGLRHTPAGSLHFYEREIRAGSGTVTVAAIQALSQGNRSTVAAYHNLCQHYDPQTVALTGIGGGIRSGMQTGDVVVATRVVYYDLRKETPAGTQHRGEELHAPARTTHSINAFFAQHDPAEFEVEDPGGATRTMRMLPGIIGSGDAVIADREAPSLAYLAAFNDKILAVDMEAAGLALACHEHSAATGQDHGWVIIRGISDNADKHKNDTHHRTASWHAAVALHQLLPYLSANTPTASTNRR